MKKLLFLVALTLIITGCENGFRGGELYLYTEIYSKNKLGTNYALYKNDKKVAYGVFTYPRYIQLPAGRYRLELSSVYTWGGDDAYEDEMYITIRRNEVTRVDIPPY